MNEINSNLSLGINSKEYAKQEAMFDQKTSMPPDPIMSDAMPNSAVNLTATVELLQKLQNKINALPVVDSNKVTTVRSKMLSGSLDFQNTTKHQEASLRIAQRLLAIDSKLLTNKREH